VHHSESCVNNQRFATRGFDAADSNILL